MNKLKKIQKILKENEKSHEIMKECDEWLTKIGFYNECCESYYKYAEKEGKTTEAKVVTELPELEYFMEKFLPAFDLTLDQQQEI